MQQQRLPADVHTVPVERRHPPRHLLPDRVPGVEIVVARRGEQHGLLGKSAQSGRDGDGLDVEAHRGANVEQVARDHQRVEVARDAEEPVELAQPIVEVGHQQDAHPTPSRRTRPSTTAQRGSGEPARCAE